MKLEWTLDFPVQPELLSLMQTAADRAVETERIRVPCSASIRLCDDEAIRTLNRSFRRKDTATDVLSFPAVSWPEGKTAGQAEKLLKRSYDDESGCCFLGDVVISVPHLVAQAKEYGHSLQREAAYLLVHAICHLMGYDHIKEEEKRIMRAQEEKILGSMAIGQQKNAMISDEDLLELARDAMRRSYSPYSHYPVGAALHSIDGRVFQGCNIENASFGGTICAERTAMVKAVSEGAREFDVIAIATGDTPGWPCGICRQFMSEFAPNIRVLVTWGSGHVEESTLQSLLPHQFELKG